MQNASAGKAHVRSGVLNAGGSAHEVPSTCDYFISVDEIESGEPNSRQAAPGGTTMKPMEPFGIHSRMAAKLEK